MGELWPQEVLFVSFACHSDMNIPKFVAEDIPLFTAMLGDLFPGVEPPPPSTDELREAVKEEMLAANLEVCSSFT